MTRRWPCGARCSNCARSTRTPTFGHRFCLWGRSRPEGGRKISTRLYFLAAFLTLLSGGSQAPVRLVSRETDQSGRFSSRVRNMNHFTLVDWVDFVRRLKDRSTTAQMQRHLDEGCKQCSIVARMWRDLSDFGSKERLYRPPDQALRSVRGYYSLLKPGRGRPRAATMASLIFDSFLEAIPAGIRSSQPSPRQVMYSAGNFLIYMRLDRGTRRVYLVGQAQRRVGPRRNLAGVNVSVLRGDETVARMRSNQFGEFQFELDPVEEKEEITIVLEGPTPVVIPLRNIGAAPGRVQTPSR